MKKIFLPLIIICTFISFNNANGALPIGAYIGLRGGVSVDSGKDKNFSNFNIQDNSKPFASLNAGIRFLKFRGELEYLYRYNLKKIEFGSFNKEISTASLMGNLYYNIITLPFFRFYLNGGLGYTDFDNYFTTNKGSFTFSLGLGASLTLAETFAIDLGYRYFDMGKAEFNFGKVKFYANDIYLGLRVGF